MRVEHLKECLREAQEMVWAAEEIQGNISEADVCLGHRLWVEMHVKAMQRLKKLIEQPTSFYIELPPQPEVVRPRRWWMVLLFRRPPPPSIPA